MPDGSTSKPLVMIGAGGTGGHMFPAAAFADEMRSRGWQVGLLSDARGLSYAADFPADWKAQVKAAAPRLSKPWALPSTLLKLLRGAQEARAIMVEKQPALAAGFGGYPAFPLLRAARRRGVPILIHEQNAVLGRVNRQFARSAGAIASGFAKLERLPAGVDHLAIGNPVRAPIAAVRERAYPPVDGDLTILVTGGSQGARIIGQTIPLAISNHLPAPLRARIKVVQQVREEQLAEVALIYREAGIRAELKPFFDDMPERLAAAHFVIARSGAGTVSEIAAVGRPALLIPLAIAMDDHQAANAAALVDAGAADMVLEQNLFPALMGELIKVRLEDTGDLQARAAAAKAVGNVKATSDLADLAEGLARK